MDLILLALFVLTFTSILILPGPNAAFAVGQSLKYGVSSSLLVALGFAAETGLHAIIVFSGLGVIVQEQGYFLTIIKWLGVAYLLFLAFKTWLAVPAAVEVKARKISKPAMFLSAMVVSLTNPKALLASLLTYPLFISANHPYLPQALVLSLCAMGISFSVYGTYSALAAVLKNRLAKNKVANRIVSGLYLGAAGTLAFK